MNRLGRELNMDYQRWQYYEHCSRSARTKEFKQMHWCPPLFSCSRWDDRTSTLQGLKIIINNSNMVEPIRRARKGRLCGRHARVCETEQKSIISTLWHSRQWEECLRICSRKALAEKIDANTSRKKIKRDTTVQFQSRVHIHRVKGTAGTAMMLD